ncbi:U4/U6.U5 tri-snRNP-associated protein 2 (Inactive ubiquitin-specific peptidase 39) [Durusdinium trenchii]|uniref:U4/U6.U5 tri-snRNP-associated protein 2 (Inactive ubiquitin-specific peptidase 39) n=1 Tax=Durusdinium trenchii TaxID=1381693 RepID=A0ABP0N3Z7_9DINO
MEKNNVYSCLVCGKYLKGRGNGTPVETHAVQAGHFVFINLEDARIYCVPDNYEVVDSSLRDIQSNLKPRLTEAEIRELSSGPAERRTDTFNTQYVPGFSPMNDFGKGDYINAVVLMLAHVPPLRDFFLRRTDADWGPSTPSTRVARLFGSLVCKLWNPRRMKAAVGAHELVEAVSARSKKRFRGETQNDAKQFLVWLLHELHVGLGGTARAGSSIVHECFQGEVSVQVEVLERASKSEGAKVLSRQTKVVPALLFSLDLPDSPLFKAAGGSRGEGGADDLRIPQIDLATALAKFDGQTPVDGVQGDNILRKRYRIVRLPPFVILHINRFVKNKYGLEKNATIVNLTLDRLDLGSLGRLSADELSALTLQELKALAAARNLDPALGGEERTALQARLQETQTPAAFRLVANLCHKPLDEGKARSGAASSSKSSSDAALRLGTYVTQLRDRAAGRWFELQNMHVRDTIAQLVACSESYLACFERSPG